MTENRRLKIIVIGDSNVGKTSLLLRFAKHTFEAPGNSTIGIDVLRAQININDKNVDLDLTDTAGQERYRSLLSSYLRSADGVLLVYDVARLVTFTELPTWLFDLRKVNETAAVMIVGNKIDEANPKERVEAETVKEFADKNELDFIEASAKSGENVEKIFQRLTQKILDQGEEKKEDADGYKITLSESEPGKKKKITCCYR